MSMTYLRVTHWYLVDDVEDGDVVIVSDDSFVVAELYDEKIQRTYTFVFIRLLK
jgi:hypothetical protein